MSVERRRRQLLLDGGWPQAGRRAAGSFGHLKFFIRETIPVRASYADAFLAAACCALGCVLGTIVLIEERPGPAPLAGIERPLHPAPFANAFVADANHDEVLPPPLPL